MANEILSFMSKYAFSLSIVKILQDLESANFVDSVKKRDD